MPGLRITVVTGSMSLALLGAGLFAWTWFPPPMSRTTHRLAVVELMPERLDLTLESPAWLRGGTAENYALQLTRPEDAAGRWLASAALHAGGAQVSPASQQGGPIAPGERVEYRWQVVARSGADVTVEMSLRLRRDQEQGTVWAQAAEPEVLDYLGMDAVTARVAGVLAAAIGAMITAIARRVSAPLPEVKR